MGIAVLLCCILPFAIGAGVGTATDDSDSGGAPWPLPPPAPSVRRSSRAASEAMTVSHGGYEYRTMMENVPAAGTGELCHGSTCRPLPVGYEIAPADSDVITNVIAAFPWSTHGEHMPL